MTAVITGATGHIGGAILRAAKVAGLDPVALARRDSKRDALAGQGVEVREGDILDVATLSRAFAGAELVFHVAAVHRNLDADDGASILRTAVEGTRNVLAAARQAGVGRVVYTSSAATVGFTEDPGRALDERAFLEHAESPATRAKIESERLVRAAADEGLDVVITNPSGVFGPWDYRITPATRAILGLLAGDPAFLHLCVTDVRDVARGHLLAAEKGHRGARYLLTGPVTSPQELRAIFERLAGIKPALFTPPRWLASFLAGRMEKKALRSGDDAPLTRAIVRDNFGKHLVYDSSRARAELGAAFRPAADTFRDALRWLMFRGALSAKSAAKVKAALGEAAAPDAEWR